MDSASMLAQIQLSREELELMIALTVEGLSTAAILAII
jgi:hypothetical protein